MDNHQQRKSIQNIFNRLNKDYFESFNTDVGHHYPSTVCIACADTRIVPHLILSAPPGEQFVHEPLGGFLPQDISGEKSLSACFALALGIKEIPKIIIMAHSDCAAGNMALKYPAVEDVPADHPQRNNMRSMQDYLFGIGADLPALSQESWQQAGDDEYAATNAMTKSLALVSLQNLMGYRIYQDQTKSIAEAVQDKKIEVVLLYVDIANKNLEYFDQVSRTFRVIAHDEEFSRLHMDCDPDKCSAPPENKDKKPAPRPEP